MNSFCKTANQNASHLLMNLFERVSNIQSMQTIRGQVKCGPDGVSLHGKDALQLLPQKLREKLMPFQREGILFALSMDGRSVGFVLLFSSLKTSIQITSMKY